MLNGLVEDFRSVSTRIARPVETKKSQCLTFILGVAVLFIVIFFVTPSRLQAQEATTNHRVILRRDPTTSSPALEHLSKDTKLTLVDALPDSGFYHVRTEDDRVGWVFGKYVSISTAETPTTPATPIITPSTECDPSISVHVYHPNRLILKHECIAVTGTIVDATATQSKHQTDGTRHEHDGDTHGWLKVDSGFENLLNSGNANDENGNPVFEIICRFPITQTDAKAACEGYTDQISLAARGFSRPYCRQICAGYFSRSVE